MKLKIRLTALEKIQSELQTNIKGKKYEIKN